MKRTHFPLAICFFFVVLFVATIPNSERRAFGEDKKAKEVAGKADMLRHVPKKFAMLTNVNIEGRQIELDAEDEEQPVVWKVNLDAEIKIHGWWGRMEQFKTGDRVWVWFAIDRKKQPKSVLMLADEISQQDIHGLPHTLKSFDAQEGNVTVESAVNGERALQFADDLDLTEQVGSKVFIQTAGKTARVVATEEQFESMRQHQKELLRKEWRTSGLPGTVTFLHPLGGEMDVMLDHEAIRWGRYLKRGDQVTLQSDDPITAVVKHVRPWRERTQLRLVTDSGVDQADLSIGQRVGIVVPEPPAEIQESNLPTHFGRFETKEQRIEWLLASIYCPCGIAGDRCTGMFYALASCNVNACAMPNQVRGNIGEMVDEGMTDKQIWHELQRELGPQVVKQHLLH